MQTAVRPSLDHSVPTTGMVHLEPPDAPETSFCGAVTTKYVDDEAVDCVVCDEMARLWMYEHPEWR